MPSFLQVTVAAALIPLSLAAPAPYQKRHNGFTIKQSANPHYTKNGPAAYAKALAKYGVGKGRIGNVLAAGNGTVSATPEEFDSEYLSPVEIGGKTYNLDFDTGSSDLWVFGTGLQSQGGDHTFYSPTSASKLLSGSKWSIKYGDGSSASGTVYSDTVSVGGIAVTGQAVEVATTASDEFLTGVPDGLLGLGFDSINTVTPKKQKTWISNAIAQGLDPVFTCDFYPAKAGTYTFGSIDKSLFSGELAYTPIDSSDGFWAFTPDSVTVGSGKSQKAETGIADTGTTLMLLEDSLVEAYYAEVTGAKNDEQEGGFVFPCSGELPDFTVTVGGYDSVVPGSFINFAPLREGSSTCFGGIQSNQGIGISIYGDVWLKSQFVVFDLGTEGPRMGVAAKSGASGGNSTGSPF